MNKIGLADGSLKVSEIIEDVDVLIKRMRKILDEHFNMNKLCASWAPRLLTPDQKRCWKDILEDHLAFHKFNLSEFMETWVHDYTPETKVQSK